MGQEETKLIGPDLTQGIPAESLADGQMLVGHAQGEAVLAVRVEQKVFAVSPHCTHYNGPLAEGLVVGDTVRCPWHHACFDLRTGEAVRAPALSPIACWEVELRDGLIRVSHKREPLKPRSLGKAVAEPERIVIVGGGAAGFAAAEMLRREGYQNSIVMLSQDTALPYDRPNLSKDYLAGTIPFEYVPLRDEGFYEENNIDTRLGRPAQEIDVRTREVVLAGDDRVPYDRLLLATGAEPVRLTIPGRTSCSSILSAHWPTAGRSSKSPRLQVEPLSSGRASLGSKSPPHSARANWRSMSWHRTSDRWSAFSARTWVHSFAHSTNSMACGNRR